MHKPAAPGSRAGNILFAASKQKGSLKYKNNQTTQYMYIHVHAHVSVSVHVYVYVYVYVHMCIYIHVSYRIPQIMILVPSSHAPRALRLGSPASRTTAFRQVAEKAGVHEGWMGRPADPRPPRRSLPEEGGYMGPCWGVPHGGDESSCQES